mgnify:FL=1
MKKQRKTQAELILSYFQERPNQEIPHPEVVDWATQEWLNITGRKLRDPDRAIRKLYQDGWLVKVKKGVYKYDPSQINSRQGDDFTQSDKLKILERDNYKCVICGKGKAEGMELHVDHIKPKSLGGTNSIENGQTLCSQHNFLKKHLQATTTAKKYFIRLYELSKTEQNKELEKFSYEVLEIYEKYNINGQINWEK